MLSLVCLLPPFSLIHTYVHTHKHMGPLSSGVAIWAEWGAIVAVCSLLLLPCRWLHTVYSSRSLLRHSSPASIYHPSLCAAFPAGASLYARVSTCSPPRLSPLVIIPSQYFPLTFLPWVYFAAGFRAKPALQASSGDDSEPVVKHTRPAWGPAAVWWVAALLLEWIF